MSLKGILRLGDVQIRVMDLEAAVNHYVNYIGLLEVMRDDEGKVYLKCWDEHDHHCVILRQAEAAGIDYAAYKVLDDETLTAMEKRIVDAGVEVEHIKSGAHPKSGRRIQFKVPSGHTLQLFAEKEIIGNGMPTLNPDVEPEGLKGMAPPHLDHVLLYGPNIPETAKFFIDVLGMELTERVIDKESGVMLSAFLTCSNKPHDIAFIHYPEEGKLHHVSFWLESWSDVQRAADIIGRHKISLDAGPTRHGITRGATIYFFDPSGNRNEVFSGGYIWYPDRPSLTWDTSELGKAIFYPEGRLPDSFMNVVT